MLGRNNFIFATPRLFMDLNLSIVGRLFDIRILVGKKDEKLPNQRSFMEILQNKGETTYRESVYINGKRVRSPTFKRKTDARTWKAEMISKINRAKALGLDLKTIISNDESKLALSFEDFLHEWLDSKIKIQRSRFKDRPAPTVITNELCAFTWSLCLDQ